MTCHRSELYVETDDPARTKAAIGAFFASRAFRSIVADSPLSLRPDSPLRVLEGPETVQHLFRVSAGLDSLLVGEQEILGQVRLAAQAARREGLLTGGLSRLFDAAVRVGRSARTVQAYRAPRRSYAREAVQILHETLGGLPGRAVGIVGAGDLAGSVARELRSRGVGRLVVFNRGIAAGRRLARAFDGQARPLGRLARDAPSLDGLVLALRSPAPVLSLNGDGHRQPAMVDLSTPSAVAGDGRIWRLDQVIQRLAMTHRAAPEAIRQVEETARRAAERFVREDQDRRAPHQEVLRRLNTEAEALSARELEAALARLRHLAPRDQETVRELARSLRTKLLMQPTLALKNAPSLEQATIARTAARLFGLPTPTRRGRASR